MSDRKPFRCCACKVLLPVGRQLRKCQPCHTKQVEKWRENMVFQRAKDFPGVDIDGVHRNPRWAK